MQDMANIDSLETLSNKQRNGDEGISSSDEILESFGSYTTLHGLHFVFTRKTLPFRRAFWALLVLTSFGVLLIQIKHGIDKMMAFHTATTTETEKSEKLVFPAISICNMNMMKKSQIAGTEAQSFLDKLNPYNVEARSENMSNSFDLEKAVLKYGHNISTMLSGNCFWLDNPISCGHNFSTFVSGKFGLCHTFNSGHPDHPLLEVSSAGVRSALTLTLNVEPEEYYGYESYWGTGLRVLVHKQHGSDIPIMSKSAMVTPGFYYEVQFRQKKSYNLRYPYKSECGERQLETYKAYYQDGCLAECYERANIKRCGCRNIGTKNIGGLYASRYCTPAEIINCSIPVQQVMSPRHCDCPRECIEIKYDYSMSFLNTPSHHYWTMLKESLNYSRDSLREKYLVIKLFYETLVVDVTEEKEAYTFKDFGGDLGGNMGLFLGCSVITVCEIVDIIISLCYARRKRTRNIDVHHPK